MNLVAILMRWDPVLMITPRRCGCLCAVITLFYLSRGLKGFYSQCAKYDFIGSRRDVDLPNILSLSETMSLHYLRIAY